MLQPSNQSSAHYLHDHYDVMFNLCMHVSIVTKAFFLEIIKVDYTNTLAAIGIPVFFKTIKLSRIISDTEMSQKKLSSFFEQSTARYIGSSTTVL